MQWPSLALTHLLNHASAASLLIDIIFLPKPSLSEYCFDSVRTITDPPIQKSLIPNRDHDLVALSASNLWGLLHLLSPQN